jgi:hypothetical protein
MNATAALPMNFMGCNVLYEITNVKNYITFRSLMELR